MVCDICGTKFSQDGTRLGDGVTVCLRCQKILMNPRSTIKTIKSSGKKILLDENGRELYEFY